MTLQALAGRIGSFARASPSATSLAQRPPALTLGTLSRTKHIQATGSYTAVRAYRARVMASTASMVDQIKEKNEKYPIIVYAKSWCPYCGQVKGLFKKLGVEFQSVNLDEIYEGEQIQGDLAGITGISTVPQVFVNGKFIGGCDDTMKLHNNGELKKMFSEAGIASFE